MNIQTHAHIDHISKHMKRRKIENQKEKNFNPLASRIWEEIFLRRNLHLESAQDLQIAMERFLWLNSPRSTDQQWRTSYEPTAQVQQINNGEPPMDQRLDRRSILKAYVTCLSPWTLRNALPPAHLRAPLELRPCKDKKLSAMGRTNITTLNPAFAECILCAGEPGTM